MRLSRPIAAAIVAATTACGSSFYTGPTGPVDIASDTFNSGFGINVATMTKTADGVYYTDKVVGSGPAVATGDSVRVIYTGYLNTGATFDSNVNSTDTTSFSFKLGSTGIIPGFNSGVIGMHVGGTRLFIVPSALAYGPTGNAQAGIPRYANLVFLVNLVSKF